MKIIKFLDKTWQEIPTNENPAMNYEGHVDRCIMMFGGGYTGVTNGGIVVAKVEPASDITLLGIFWNINTAELFAEAFKIKELDLISARIAAGKIDDALAI